MGFESGRRKPKLPLPKTSKKIPLMGSLKVAFIVKTGE